MPKHLITLDAGRMFCKKYGCDFENPQLCIKRTERKTPGPDKNCVSCLAVNPIEEIDAVWETSAHIGNNTDPLLKRALKHTH